MIKDTTPYGNRNLSLLDKKSVTYENRAASMTLNCPSNPRLTTLVLVFNLSMDAGTNLQYRPNNNTANMKSYVHEVGEWGWGQNRHTSIIHNGPALVGMLGGESIRRNEVAGMATLYPPQSGTYYGRRKVICDYSIGDSEGEARVTSSIMWADIATPITSIVLTRTGNFWGEVELYKVE